METRNRYDGLDPAVVATIRVHARRLAQNGAIPAAGVDDLEQELVLDLLRRLPRFDPHRAALPTFADRVIRHRAITLLEAARAGRREGERATVSLEDLLRPRPDDAAEAALDRLAPGGAFWGGVPAPVDDAVGLRRDLERLVLGLPAPLRRCCVWLADGSIAEAARRSGVPRTSLYGLLARLRKRCRDAGLEIYLGRARRIPEPAGK
jgi:RNA polymerase sigma-70 factor (ECF subfamily)